MIATAFLVFYRFKSMNKEEAEKAKVEGKTSFSSTLVADTSSVWILLLSIEKVAECQKRHYLLGHDSISLHSLFGRSQYCDY
jgi:hypothetical protein